MGQTITIKVLQLPQRLHFTLLLTCACLGKTPFFPSPPLFSRPRLPPQSYSPYFRPFPHRFWRPASEDRLVCGSFFEFFIPRPHPEGLFLYQFLFCEFSLVQVASRIIRILFNLPIPCSILFSWLRSRTRPPDHLRTFSERSKHLVRPSQQRQR